MSTPEIIQAYEAGLITRGEAIEQALVDDLSGLYEKGARRQNWSKGNFAGDSARYASR